MRLKTDGSHSEQYIRRRTQDSFHIAGSYFYMIVVGQLLIGPLFVWVDFQVVSLYHSQALGDELQMK